MNHIGRVVLAVVVLFVLLMAINVDGKAVQKPSQLKAIMGLIKEYSFVMDLAMHEDKVMHQRIQTEFRSTLRSYLHNRRPPSTSHRAVIISEVIRCIYQARAYIIKDVIASKKTDSVDADYLERYASGWIYTLWNILKEPGFLPHFDQLPANEFPGGLTPIHLAAWLREHIILEELLGEDSIFSDMNARVGINLPKTAPEYPEKYIVSEIRMMEEGHRGMTALHFAAMNDDAKATQLLIQSGADQTIQDIVGRTALDVAITLDFKDTIALLRPNKDPESQQGYDDKEIISTEEEEESLCSISQSKETGESCLDVGSPQSNEEIPDSFKNSGWRKSSKPFERYGRDCPVVTVDVNDLTKEKFFREFFSIGRPLRVSHAVEHFKVVGDWKRETLVSKHGLVQVSGGSIPYGNVFGEPRDAITLDEFITYLDSQAETPVQEPFYIFDEKILTNASFFSPEDNPIPTGIAQAFEGVPRFLQFYLGGENTGAPLHLHCPAINFLIHGKKRWFFYPPAKSITSKKQANTWLLDEMKEKQLYEETGEGRYETIPPESLPYECEQNSGDILFVPPTWGHLIVNTAESIGLAIEFDLGFC